MLVWLVTPGEPPFCRERLPSLSSAGDHLGASKAPGLGATREVQS